MGTMSEKSRPVLQRPLKSAHLDESEQALERSFQQDNWVEVKDEAEKARYQAAARLTKNERTNIRLSESDMEGIKRKANEKGLGYQTLIASIVHQYISGRLVEVEVDAVARSTADQVAIFVAKYFKSSKEGSKGEKAKTKASHAVARRRVSRSTKHA
jgi:predicted DNA binding CopG/RHH family protein